MATSVSSFCGSRSVAFKAGAGLAGRTPVTRGATATQMRKRDIHPEWYGEAKVFCNGVEVMTVGGTKSQYNVDIYSGNHPFYQGNSTMIVMDEGQLNKFSKRFSGLGEFGEVGAAASASGPATDDETTKKMAKAKAAGKATKKRR
ncbi:RPL31 [Scenedesmus sp. PABB004]|nr:RPL31 [Scenedesmus sp. PABB004]